jgi:hypothetical protein
LNIEDGNPNDVQIFERWEENTAMRKRNRRLEKITRWSAPLFILLGKNYSSSSIGTTTLSWVSACSTVVEHSQQEGFTECRCQRHVKPPTWRGQKLLRWLIYGQDIKMGWESNGAVKQKISLKILGDVVPLCIAYN